MTTLGFTVTFHSPFRVGAAYARDGISAAIDRGNPLAADHLKGLMRSSANALLRPEHALINEVFGSVRRPSPWSWSSAVLPDGAEWKTQERHRVRIDPGTGTAMKDHLVLGETAWTPAARFEITCYGPMGDATEADHVRLLRCAAAGVHGLGAWRRRGLGWVGITPDDGPVTSHDVAGLLALAGER